MTLVEKALEYVEPLYQRTSWEHGWPHIQSVELSTIILTDIINENRDPKNKIDLDLCKLAVYGHDLGRTTEKQGPQLGSTKHASDSVSLTINLLKSLGASDYQMSTVVGAIAVHADRSYGGRNDVAKVLRDCDKSDALGPWGTLRCTRHWFKRDLVPTEEIVDNWKNQQIIKDFAINTSGIIKSDPELLKVYLNNLNFVLEWVDSKMLDTIEGYSFLRKNYEFSKQERQFLLSDTLEQLTEKSRDKTNLRKRAMYSFHKPEDTGKQFLINMIQSDSYIQPHAHFEEEYISHLQGRLCSFQFDSQGKITRRTNLKIVFII